MLEWNDDGMRVFHTFIHGHLKAAQRLHSKLLDSMHIKSWIWDRHGNGLRR